MPVSKRSGSASSAASVIEAKDVSRGNGAPERDGPSAGDLQGATPCGRRSVEPLYGMAHTDPARTQHSQSRLSAGLCHARRPPDERQATSVRPGAATLDVHRHEAPTVDREPERAGGPEGRGHERPEGT